jgi:ubiquinone/menaquinone biosynthesis C-methylase UbiE
MHTACAKKYSIVLTSTLQTLKRASPLIEMKSTNYLQHLQALNGSFLHANGEKGTELLIQKLNLKGTETVLEIGCGTGATLVKLKSRYPKLEITGMDADQQMLDKSQKRIRFCCLDKQVKLVHIDEKHRIPINSIDIVYIESVLGILDERTLLDTVNFIYTVLKPNGTLVLNESIWLEGITMLEIDSINNSCKNAFGLIQCTAMFADVNATIKIFDNSGFTPQFFERIRNVDKLARSQTNYRENLSQIYSWLGKFKLVYNRKAYILNEQFKAEMKKIFTPNREYLSGVLLVLKKNGSMQA